MFGGFGSLFSGSRWREGREGLPVKKEEQGCTAPPPATEDLAAVPRLVPCAPCPFPWIPLVYDLFDVDGEGLGIGVLATGSAMKTGEKMQGQPKGYAVSCLPPPSQPESWSAEQRPAGASPR